MALPTNINPRRAGAQGATRRLVLAGGGVAFASLLMGQTPTDADNFRPLPAQKSATRLRGADGLETPVWAFAGAVPGPTLRARRGSELSIRLQNDLPEPIAVHWHGVRGRNACDGVVGLTQAAVAPGASFDYRLALPDAGTFWYRAHGLTSRGPARGLHGMLIVDEAAPPEVDHDVPLVLNAWQLDPDGALDVGASPGEPIFTANGARSVDVPVRTNERVRLRLLNASADILTVRVEQHAPIVMAIDGQPATPFPARSGRLRLAPGNRADLFVDAVLAPGATAPIVLETEHGDVPVARLVYGSQAPSRPTPRPDPVALPANPLPERMDFIRAVKLTVGVETLTARTPPGEPAFRIKRGRAVILGLRNATAQRHVVHVHGHAFRLLDALDDGWKPFWLDTLPIEARQTARIAFVADNPGKWLLEARALGTGDGGGGAWFEVT